MSAYIAGTGAPNCCGNARSATSGTRSSRRGSPRRRRRRSPNWNRRKVSASSGDLAQRSDHRVHLLIGLLVAALGPDHEIGAPGLVGDWHLSREALASFRLGDAITMHHALHLRFRLTGDDDDHVE